MDFFEYCQPFIGSGNTWPDLPLPEQATDCWWRQWFDKVPETERFNKLRFVLPQLYIKPHNGARSSDIYKRLVLRGDPITPQDQNMRLYLNDENGLKFSLVDHSCGVLPVLSFNNLEDFVSVLCCLANRCEPFEIKSSVHSHAIGGLIHWGLIKDIDRSARAQLLLLHNAPYSSLPSKLIPGHPSDYEWLDLSHTWRLNHEIAHIYCRQLVGEMRINLLDELLADYIGMRASLGIFSADLFRLGLGLSTEAQLSNDSRACTYISELNSTDQKLACKAVIARSIELEALFKSDLLPHDEMHLLRYLTNQQLNKVFYAPSQ